MWWSFPLTTRAAAEINHKIKLGLSEVNMDVQVVSPYLLEETTNNFYNFFYYLCVHMCITFSKQKNQDKTNISLQFSSSGWPAIEF